MPVLYTSLWTSRKKGVSTIFLQRYRISGAFHGLTKPPYRPRVRQDSHVYMSWDYLFEQWRNIVMSDRTVMYIWAELKNRPAVAGRFCLWCQGLTHFLEMEQNPSLEWPIRLLLFKSFILCNNEPMNCIFCDIIKNRKESFKIWEDAHFLLLLDIKPINPGHFLLLPKKHVDDIFVMTE